jgi:hypothetical protein
MSDTLPPLPAPLAWGTHAGHPAQVSYTSDQMHAYAEACVIAATAECSAHWQAKLDAAVAAERERCATLCERTYPEWNPDWRESIRKPCFDTPAECAAAIRATPQPADDPSSPRP